MRVVVLAAAMLLVMALLPQQASAASPADSYCSVVIPSSTVLLSNSSAFGSLMSLAALIMLLMATVAGFIFAIGYAFKIDKLTRFSKAELGEILITAMVAFIFLGTFSAVNSTAGPSALFYASGGALSRGIFFSDCTQLYSSSAGLVLPLISIGLQDDFYSALSTITVSIEPNQWGAKFSPFAGYNLVVALVNTFMAVTGGLIGLTFAITFFLAVVYAVFPIFFFVGIVLRTLPWTRAAGGSFLGLFMGFYIMFPLLMHYALSINTLSLAAVTENGALTGVMSMFLSLNSLNPLTLFANIVSFISSTLSPASMVQSFIQGVIDPALYVVFALVISLIISFDFTETVGDFLGAPSLSSKNTLKGII